MANSPTSRKASSTTLTIRVAGGTKQKGEWKAKAKRAGMSLTLYVCYVMDRTDLVVSMSHKTDPAIDRNADDATKSIAQEDDAGDAIDANDSDKINGTGVVGVATNGKHDKPRRRA
jgi:hypothetical protein